MTLQTFTLGTFSQGEGAAGGAFESIATVTPSGVSTITFSAIPSTYQHLQIRYLGKSNDSAANTHYQFSIIFNGDTASNYSYHRLSGDGSSAADSGAATQTAIKQGFAVIPSSGTSILNPMGAGIIDILDYTSTTKNKTVRMIAGSDTNYTLGSGVGRIVLNSGLWFKTPEAITSITLILDTGFWSGTSSRLTTFALYGIKGA